MEGKENLQLIPRPNTLWRANVGLGLHYTNIQELGRLGSGRVVFGVVCSVLPLSGTNPVGSFMMRASC